MQNKSREDFNLSVLTWQYVSAFIASDYDNQLYVVLVNRAVWEGPGNMECVRNAKCIPNCVIIPTYICVCGRGVLILLVLVKVVYAMIARQDSQ